MMKRGHDPRNYKDHKGVIHPIKVLQLFCIHVLACIHCMCAYTPQVYTALCHDLITQQCKRTHEHRL